jgi:hypothetical protein
MKSIAMFALVAAGMLSQAHAALVTISGAANNSTFDVVYDNSALSLFGTPSLSNNVVFFTPTTFAANAIGVNQAQTTNSTVNLRIIPLAGYDFAGFDLLERGDFYLEGASSRVRAQGQLRAFDIATPLVEFSDNIVSTTASGPAIGTLLGSIAANSAYRDGNNYNWVGTASISSLGNGLATADEVNITIENILRANTLGPTPGELGLEAFIEKKFAGGSVGLTVSMIPEPSEIGMILSGLAMIGFIARRRPRLA